MGVTLHYRGKLKSPSLIEPLISLTGLELVAGYGFIVESEDELGKIITMEMPPPEKLAQLTWDVLANMGEINTAFTKTQFAGAETHILLCKLLRYLDDYLQDLTRYLQALANKAPIKPKF
jgi:hypothetical protein